MWICASLSHMVLGVWIALSFKTVLCHRIDILWPGTNCLRQKRETVPLSSVVSLEKRVDTKDPVKVKQWFFSVPHVNWELSLLCTVCRCVLSSRRKQRILFIWKIPLTTFTLMLLRHSATIWGSSVEVKWRVYLGCSKGCTELVSLWANGSSTLWILCFQH